MSFVQRVLVHGAKLACCLFICQVAHAAEQTREADYTDIEYATTPDGPLALDLYMPADVASPPLIVWVHGGAWRFGSKASPAALPIVERGYALASISFRQSTTAPFPAQLHDIKAAVRFLRANAGQYGYQADNVAIWGHSSGGHLAALTGTTNDAPELNGNLGEYLQESSEVQAIIDMAGPSDFTTILTQSTELGVNVRKPALELLLDGDLETPEVQQRAREASPFFQASAGDAPLLVMHGLQDPQVPVNQALQLQAVYQQVGLPVEHHWLLEAAHASPDYYSGAAMEKIVAFLQRYLD